MGFNKGEWSELYTFLYLLENQNLVIVDENLKVIEKDLFKIIEIIVTNNNYKIDNKNIIKTSINGLKKEYSLEYISQNNKILLNKILSHKKAKGSFEIDELLPLINDLLDGKKLKGSSKVKGDLKANVFDNKFNKIVNLSYNIKSSLGSSATLLNASNNTNFIYEVKNIDDTLMNKNNSINSTTKLLDRSIFLNKNNAKIDFVKVQSDIFNFNLSLIDSNLNKIFQN